MTVSIISVGTLKEDYLKDAVAEYKKRLSQYAKVEEISIKEERITNEEDRKSVSSALEAEGEKILASIPKGAISVALCIEGKEYSSEELAQLVKRARDESGKIVIIIGSSHGLADRVKNSCDFRVSFSKLTFPHQLMRVIVYEALYRSFTIIAGKKYHK